MTSPPQWLTFGVDFWESDDLRESDNFNESGTSGAAGGGRIVATSLQSDTAPPWDPTVGLCLGLGA